jgi:hypothetical protein
MKERNRSYRRAQRSRIRAKRIDGCYWGYGAWRGDKWNAGALGVAINTPTPHSCSICSNDRKYFGETIGERRSSDMFSQDVEEYVNSLN